MSDRTKLPRYLCHKQVNAAKIGHITIAPQVVGGPVDDKLLACLPPGVHAITPGVELTAIRVTGAWFDKHKPEVGGYYIAYDDGYESYSPAAAFEGGYTIMGNVTAKDPVGRNMLALLNGKKLSAMSVNTITRHVTVVVYSEDRKQLLRENDANVLMVGRCDELVRTAPDDEAVGLEDGRMTGLRTLSETAVAALDKFKATADELLAAGFSRVASA